MPLIKVSATSRPQSVAGAISGMVRDHAHAEIIAVGPDAVNQAVKAIAIARKYLELDGIDLVMVPNMEDIVIDGNQRTAIVIQVRPRPAQLSP
ncbi:MAG: stage V sporulation protein S [Caldilineales bacterium]|nr:stage V sporulation protein S [Caldilineales bacterium]MDW8316568.1 stage V sporulation protein S [Anaerolineae bacterium]